MFVFVCLCAGVYVNVHVHAHVCVYVRALLQTLLHPFDVIKTVEQASKTKLGMVQAFKQVFVCRVL